MADISTVTISLGGETNDGFVHAFTNGVSATHFEDPNTQLRVSTFDGSAAAKKVQRAYFEFQWPNTIQQNSDGYLLDPPRFASATLNVFCSNIVGAPKLRVFLQNEPTPDEFGASFWPGPTLPPDAPATILTTRNYVDVTGRDDFGFQSAHSPILSNNSIALDVSGFVQQARDVAGTDTWNGKFHLVVLDENELVGYSNQNSPVNKASADSRVDLGSVGDGNPATLTINYVPFHTGWFTHRDDRTRAVRDARLGSPAFSSDLVEDGYLKGIWVHDWDRDPDDREEDRYKGRRREIRTDKIPVD